MLVTCVHVRNQPKTLDRLFLAEIWTLTLTISTYTHSQLDPLSPIIAMVSPFDLAASHPTIGGATKKKLPDFSSVPDIVVSNTDMISFSSSSEDVSHPESSPPGINEVMTVTFSAPTNNSAFQAFDQIDVEEGTRDKAKYGDPWIEQGSPSPSSSLGGSLAGFYRPPKLIEGDGRRLSGLSMDGSTAGMCKTVLPACFLDNFREIGTFS